MSFNSPWLLKTIKRLCLLVAVLGVAVGLLASRRAGDRSVSDRSASDRPASVRDDAILTTSVPAAPKLRTVPIASIRPGMRVIAQNPQLSGFDTGQSDFDDPSRLRLIRLTMAKAGHGQLHIELIRPTFWLIEQAWKTGRLGRGRGLDQLQRSLIGATVFLDMSEMGADGPARIEAIEPCPAVEASADPSRHVVTGVFRHTSGSVRYLDIEGEVEPIGVTDAHRFWSEDRQDFVAAGALRIGEHLRRADGTVVRLVRSTPKRGPPTPVYNLEVDAQHVYHVGASGILVHNNYQGSEFVYALYHNGEEIYYGITNDVARRVREHARDGKVFEHLQVLTENVNHHVARTLEGGLIRNRLAGLDQALQNSLGVEAALEQVGLLNKNRGRIMENWLGSINNLDDLQSHEIWDKVRRVGGNRLGPDGNPI